MNQQSVDDSAVIPRMDINYLLDRFDALAEEFSVPSICDNCVHYELCAMKLKACNEFTEFVETTPRGLPIARMKKMEEEILKDGSERVPTHEIYLEHFVL